MPKCTAQQQILPPHLFAKIDFIFVLAKLVKKAPEIQCFIQKYHKKVKYHLSEIFFYPKKYPIFFYFFSQILPF